MTMNSMVQKSLGACGLSLMLCCLAAVVPLLGQVHPAPLLASPAPPLPPPPPDVQVLIRSGSFLGVNVSEIDTARAKELKLKEEHGVEITGVEEGSPAEKSGLRKGDVVVEYQGNRVEGTEQFIRMVRETPAGRQVRMNLVRGGAPQTITAVIGSRKDRLEKESWSFGHVAPRLDVWIPDIPRAFTSWRSSMLGVEAESLEGQLAGYFGVKGGVLVRSIVKGSAAERAGIKAGDVILRVDKEEVASPRELSNTIRTMRSKKTFPLVLMREKKEITISVTLDEDRSESERTPGRSIVRREELDEF